jgi:ketosteroid isomerase-like protein
VRGLAGAPAHTIRAETFGGTGQRRHVMSVATGATRAEACTGVPGTDAPEPKEHWFLEPFNAGDLDGVMRFFESDAVCTTPSGGLATGADEIRALFAQLIEAKLHMRGRTTSTACRADTALTSFEWSLTGTTPDGSPTVQEGTAALVFRRQRSGGWLIAVENPFNR